MNIDERRRGVTTVAVAVAAVVVFIGAAVGIASSFGTPSSHISPTESSCFPPYLSALAAQVQSNQKFTSEEHGLSYVLASGGNESGTTGQVNGKPYSTPPNTALTFYSYGSEPITVCPANFPSSTIQGVLWVHVPLSSDGSYNLSNMSVYFTPGLFKNSTATG